MSRCDPYPLVFLILLGAGLSAADDEDICYQSSEFNEQGQGFMEYPNSTMCCYYYECWKVQGTTTIDTHRRTCPPGTWFDPINGPNGVPCIASKPYENCVDTCGTCINTPYDGECHLYPNPTNNREFGYISDSGSWEELGRCAKNFVFDHSACTCLGPATACFCMLDLNFVDGYNDNSCHTAYVKQMPDDDTIDIVPAPIPTEYAAEFGGYNHTHHFNIPLFNGMYGCHSKCLSVGFFMNADSLPAAGMDRGIISYGDCDPGPSWGIKLVGDTLECNVGSLSASYSSIQINTWYYVSMVFKKKNNGDSIWLYVMTVAESADCENNCNCPDHVASNTRSPTECIQPRPCGLDIGYGYPDTFFEGSIGRVQVFHKCHRMACEGLHCTKFLKNG